MQEIGFKTLQGTRTPSVTDSVQFHFLHSERLRYEPRGPSRGDQRSTPQIQQQVINEAP